MKWNKKCKNEENEPKKMLMNADEWRRAGEHYCPLAVSFDFLNFFFYLSKLLWQQRNVERVDSHFFSSPPETRAGLTLTIFSIAAYLTLSLNVEKLWVEWMRSIRFNCMWENCKTESWKESQTGCDWNASHVQCMAQEWCTRISTRRWFTSTLLVALTYMAMKWFISSCSLFWCLKRSLSPFIPSLNI